jgi:hypothetical protein
MNKKFNVEGISCNELALECSHGDFVIKCRHRHINGDKIAPCYNECGNDFLFYDPLHAEGYVCEHAMGITNSGLPICCANELNSKVDSYFGNYEPIMSEQIETVPPVMAVPCHIQFEKSFDNTAEYPEKEIYSITPNKCDIGCSCVTFQFTRLYDKIVTEHSKVSICQGTYHSMGFESIACSERNRIINLIK